MTATGKLVAPGLRRVVRWAAILNLGYFGVEFAVALAIGSVSLFADSVDFLEGASGDTEATRAKMKEPAELLRRALP